MSATHARVLTRALSFCKSADELGTKLGMTVEQVAESLSGTRDLTSNQFMLALDLIAAAGRPIAPIRADPAGLSPEAPDDVRDVPTQSDKPAADPPEQ